MGLRFFTTVYGFLKIIQFILCLFLFVSVFPNQSFKNASSISAIGISVGFFFLLVSFASIAAGFAWRKESKMTNYVIFEIFTLAALVTVWIILYIASVMKYNGIIARLSATPNQKISQAITQALHEIDFVYGSGCATVTIIMVYQIAFVIIVFGQNLLSTIKQDCTSDSQSSVREPGCAQYTSESQSPVREPGVREPGSAQEVVGPSRPRTMNTIEVTREGSSGQVVEDSSAEGSHVSAATSFDSSAQPLFSEELPDGGGQQQRVMQKSRPHSVSDDSECPILASSESSIDHSTTTSTKSLRESPLACSSKKTLAATACASPTFDVEVSTSSQQSDIVTYKKGGKKWRDQVLLSPAKVTYEKETLEKSPFKTPKSPFKTAKLSDEVKLTAVKKLEEM